MKILIGITTLLILGGGYYLFATSAVHAPATTPTTYIPATIVTTTTQTPSAQAPPPSTYNITSPDSAPRRPTAPQEKPEISQPSPVQIIGDEPNYDRKTLEKLFHKAVNRQRQNRNIPTLKWRKDLARVARKYSREQATQAQAKIDAGEHLTSVEIRHTGTTFGATPLNRLYTKEVYDFSLAGENIISIPLLTRDESDHQYHWQTPQELADTSAIAWMISPGHRKNILTEEFTHTGIGIVRVGNFLIATQLFIKEIDCGYPDGKCCKPDDTHDELFCYGDNICNRQRDDEMKCDMPE